MMKRPLLASAIASLFAASMALAEERPSSPPVKRGEGTEHRLIQGEPSTQPVKAIEGPASGTPHAAPPGRPGVSRSTLRSPGVQIDTSSERDGSTEAIA